MASFNFGQIELFKFSKKKKLMRHKVADARSAAAKTIKRQGKTNTEKR